MKIVRIDIPFENKMTKLQTTLGWIYLPLHAVALPLLLSMYGRYSGLGDGPINLIYYGIGILFVAVVMLRYLRSAFDVLCDRLLLCLLCILLAILVDYAMSLVSALLLLLLQDIPQNPNNAAILEAAGSARGVMAGIGIFLAPVVEEILFRGTVFGSIRGRSRGLAYVVSTVLFCLYHVWQYAAASGDPGLLLYAIQYIPMSVALAWTYERSGSIWTPIFFHMGYNAISYLALLTLETL